MKGGQLIRSSAVDGSVSNRINTSKTVKDSSLIKLVELLQCIDTESPTAKLNEKSITDNNGGRIEL